MKICNYAILLGINLFSMAAFGQSPAPNVTGVLERTELEAVLARGPQAFIAGLVVEAVLEGKRFQGFRIVEILPESPLYQNRVLKPGDVILKVNGQPLERPDQFMQIWEKIQQKQKLELIWKRDSEKMHGVWTIPSA